MGHKWANLLPFAKVAYNNCAQQHELFTAPRGSGLDFAPMQELTPTCLIGRLGKNPTEPVVRKALDEVRETSFPF